MIHWFTYSPENPLLFTRPIFWIFFLIVFAVFSLIYKNTFWRNTWLFAVSVFFYYKSSGFFFILILISILVNYLLGNRLYYAKKKKKWIVFALFYNLLWLVYFKYTYFFIQIINKYFGTNFIVKDWLLDSFNQFAHTNFNASTIILPVGISFYTFQIISYIVDLYKGRVKPVKNILDFGFYVSFFPQLVAGPIVRASSFIPQMYAQYRLQKEEFGQALFFIINGLIKKIVIADYISINFVDRVFDNPLTYTGLENLLAIYGYAIQIYCDFSGYTDIAIGLALLMGFRLPLNFNSPYKAVNFSDFWKRWHISLSSWLKDYLYIPLGGNKKGKFRTYINLFVTMLLGGLWHGAALRFIIWGGLHGIYLIAQRLLSNLFKTTNKHLNFLRIFFVFHIVIFTWIVFRANDLQTAKQLFNQLFFNFKASHFLEIVAAHRFTLLLMLSAFVIHWLPEKTKNWYRGKFVLLPLIPKIIITLIVIFLLVQFVGADIQAFIYFQF